MSSGTRRVQHSWHSTPAGNFFSSLSTRRRSPRCKFEARITERVDVFPGWFSSSLLIPLAFVDRWTRGIKQVNEQASERAHPARGEVAWEIPRTLNVSRGRINGTPPSMTTEAYRNEILHYLTLSFPFLSYLFLIHSSGQVRLALFITRALPRYVAPIANYISSFVICSRGCRTRWRIVGPNERVSVPQDKTKKLYLRVYSTQPASSYRILITAMVILYFVCKASHKV